ncbi:MAG: hypothetical protein WDN25_10520 [Acetobacteraceae bacterium]
MGVVRQGHLHRQKGFRHRIDRRGVESIGHHGAHLLALAVDLAQYRVGGRTQMQAPDAAILRVGAALDHAAPLQPVDQPGDGDRLDFQDLGEFLLRQAGLAFQPDQDSPLRAGHAVRARPLVGVDADQPRHIVQQEHQVALEIMHRGHSLIECGADHKPRYDKAPVVVLCTKRRAGPPVCHPVAAATVPCIGGR